MHLVELSAAGNEASDLLRVHDPELLRELGARAAYWTVLDEGPVEECLALLVLGHDGAWSARHVRADAGGQAGRTEDAEALAWHDGWVYVLGSHFGKKKGPLRPKRAFVARFRESLAPRLEIVRNQFALHRAVNDAVAEVTGTPAPGVRESFIAATMRRGLEKGRAWVDYLFEDDHPINVEGAAFTRAGTLLIGLRWPVSKVGEPILVEVEWPWGGAPVVKGVHVLPIGGGPLGIRAVSARDDGSFDIVVGSIDALDKGSVLLDEHPEARDATCAHYRYALGGVAQLVADLAPLHHVEGVSELDGQPLYVTDEDHRIALYRVPAR
ncbi:hypothetical protein [Allorhizocola rhizosphaerae]|uniref:hypothetical protein n=1 Tax=Allorhizocola rhizosphaerae TaxID=1872709 RepID=UPI000E3CFC96|nr:hypothetical protein [Allorhizocola rhizosphaerae]